VLTSRYHTVASQEDLGSVRDDIGGAGKVDVVGERYCTLT